MRSLKREPMPIRQAAELISKLARTVQYAHEHGILHRDIKPGNILLDEKGEPHLTDFGLARLVETDSTVTGTRDVMGTPSYMAPEQAAGETTKFGKATDVYGLGAVLYQLLTGHPPFVGGTTYETIQLLLNTEPRQPRVLNQQNRSRAFHGLPEVPRERSAAPLLVRSRAGGRPRTLAKARTNPCAAHRNFCARQNGCNEIQLQPSQRCRWLAWSRPSGDRFEKRVMSAGANGIAVLPFENLSDKPTPTLRKQSRTKFFTRLSKISDLKVISRYQCDGISRQAKHARDW